MNGKSVCVCVWGREGRTGHGKHIYYLPTDSVTRDRLMVSWYRGLVIRRMKGGRTVSCHVTSRYYHSKCACGGQSLALPHHLVCSKGGHCRPAPLECLITSRRLCISPIPQDTLHALHSDQSPTRQSLYSAKIRQKYQCLLHIINIFFFIISPLSRNGSLTFTHPEPELIMNRQNFLYTLDLRTNLIIFSKNYR